MRKVFLGVALVATLLLVGCGSAADASAPPTDTAVPTATPLPRVEVIARAYYPGAQATLERGTATIVATPKGFHCTQLDIEVRVYDLFRDEVKKLGATHLILTLNAPNGQQALYLEVFPLTVSQIDWSSDASDVAWLAYDTKTMSQHMLDYASTC